MNKEQYWLTPPDLYNKLNSEFKFDFDPCPFPRPDGYNSLIEPWGKMNYVNPPFRISDGPFGGPTQFVRKAISEKEKGNHSVLILPVPLYVDILARAQVEMRPAGRVRWLECTTRKEYTHSRACCIFIL